MKRVWLGVAILAALLILSLWVQAGMVRLHAPVSRDLERAAQASLEGDWEEATRLWTQARDRWERRHDLTAAVADHSPMDELDMLFAQLSVFDSQREAVHFAATCRAAAQMAQAMYQAHSFTWWNFL